MPATLYPIVCVDFRRPTCVTRTPSRKKVLIGLPIGLTVSISVNFSIVLDEHQRTTMSVSETLLIAIRHCVCTITFKCSRIFLPLVDFTCCIIWIRVQEESQCQTLSTRPPKCGYGTFSRTETKSDKDFRRLNESGDLRLPETKSFRRPKVSGVSGSPAAAAAVTAFHLIVFFLYIERLNTCEYNFLYNFIYLYTI